MGTGLQATRPFRLLVVVLAVSVGGSAFAGPVGAQDRSEVTRLFFDRIPSSPELFAAQVDQVNDHRYYFLQHVHDLDGDGIEDVVVQVYDITSPPGDVRFTASTGSLTVYVVSGRTGKRLWSTTRDYADGSAGVMPLRVGTDAVNGLVVFTFEAASAAYTATLTAVDGAGTELWEQTVTSSYNFYTGTGFFVPAGAATDAPTTFHPFNGVEGTAQDLLLGVSDYVVSRGGKQVGSTEAKAIDGRDGSVVEYPISATSAEMVPVVRSIADVTGDGLDEIVVLTKESADRHLVIAYDSSDASELWEAETRFSNAVSSWRMPDLTGDGKRDLVVVFDRPGSRHFFRVVDAARGRVPWFARAWAPYPIGRVDRDRRPDVGAFGFVNERRRLGTRFFAFSADGRRLYSRLHESDTSECGRNCFIFSFLLQAGDLNADGAKDRYVTQWVVGGRARSREHYIVSGRTGRKLYRRKLIPVLGNVDGRGAGDLGVRWRKGRGVVVRTLTGKTARPIWRARVRWPGFRHLTDSIQPYDSAMKLDRDRCDDLLLMGRTSRGAALVALDGRTGRLKWSSGIEDDRKPKVTARAAGPTSC